MATKEPRTTAPAGKALRGGISSFNADGSPCLAVWKALTKIKDDSDRVTSQLENRIKDRKAIEEELDEMSEGDNGFDEKAAEHYKVSKKISGLRAQRDQFIARYGRIIELTIANKIGVDATPKEIFSMTDAEEEEEEDDDAPGQLKLSGAHQPGANESFETHAMQTPGAFGGRDFETIKPHLHHLNGVTAETKGTQASTTPLRLARWIEKQFSHHKTTENRREIFPKMPEWFRDAILGIVARCATGEINKGNELEEVDAGTILLALQNAATKDVEAWLHLVGGKTAEINKTVLNSAKAG